MNTKTGQHARDLPQEADDEVSDSELAGLTSQSSSRSGVNASLGFGPNISADEVLGVSKNGYDIAGFGIPRRTGTPEPWVKKLADDGMSYYYYNKLDGKVSWTRPEAPSALLALQGSASESSLSSSQSRGNGNSRLSAYSDDSDIHPIEHPLEPLRPSRSQTNGNGNPPPEAKDPLARTRAMPNERTILEYKSAERIARSLQQALSPPPPELITELSAVTKSAIQAVVNNIQTNGFTRRSEEDRRMDDLIFGVVLAVRNLLYVSAVPTSQIPVNVLPRELRDSAAAAAASNAPSPLKPAQRKVTATLSRLVLSARAMQYDSGSIMTDILNRIEVDADELEKAVLSFVLEVQRNQHSARPDARPMKRLHGVFSPADIGLGLVGAGAAGRWKGFGWVSLDDERHSPRRVLGPEVITEINSSLGVLEEQFSYLVRALQVSGEGSGQLSTVPNAVRFSLTSTLHQWNKYVCTAGN